MHRLRNHHAIVFLTLITAFAPRAGAVRSYAPVSSSDNFGVMLGLSAAMLNLDQKMLNDLIHRANAREGGVSNGEMGTPYEFAVSIERRGEASEWGYQLRPAYFMQTSNGDGTGGKFTYAVNGETLFLNFRRYVLENENIHLYGQFGLGYGHLMGVIEENDRSAPGHGRVEFQGDSVGAVLGMGADVCSEGGHCFTIEGLLRYLKFDRTIVKSSDGAFDSYNGSLTQYGRKQELELDQQDLLVQMGGVIFQLGYAYKF